MVLLRKTKPKPQEPDTQSVLSSSASTRSKLSRRLSLSRTLSSLHLTRPSDPADVPPPAFKQPGRGFGAHVHRITTTAGIPFNRVANLVGAEGWFPQTMPRECAKAARILHSFVDGSFPGPLAGPLPSTSLRAANNGDEPFHPLGITRRAVVTIPHQVLAHCAGLAIFNTLRAGAYMGSIAAGSGLVVARRPDGTWSPPSAFVVSTLGAGLMIGLDIYECVLVLNTAAQVAAFTHPRVSLGTEMSVAIGPVGTGGAIEAAVSRTARPMYSYMKSRGFWAGVQIDGTIILARQDCNAVAYNDRRASAKSILRTQAEWPEGSLSLWQTLMGLEGLRAIMDPDMARELAMIAEYDEEDEPAPAYTPSGASHVDLNHGGDEGVVHGNKAAQQSVPEQKQRNQHSWG